MLIWSIHTRLAVSGLEREVTNYVGRLLRSNLVVPKAMVYPKKPIANSITRATKNNNN
jgi:hypothetical protein